MSTRRTSELLYDSAATLRLVDSELQELRPAELATATMPMASASTAAPALALCQTLVAAPIAAAQPTLQPAMVAAGGLSHFHALPVILERASAEIASALTNLRASRSALEETTVEKLSHTTDKLREVTSATEVAATDILDSLDRAGRLVDELDAESDGTSPKSVETRGQLRDEIFGMMNALQFQDITTQQLNYATSVLKDLEGRLVEIASLFDLQGLASALRRDEAAATPSPDSHTFDPNATTRDADRRQALADQIFTGK